jgi:hypothetical protein
MVLAALGDARSEDELATLLGSQAFGTPASRVSGLKKLGYRTIYDSFTLEDLRAYCQQSLFPIAFVSADPLSWLPFRGAHAVVILEIGQDEMIIHDPALETGALQVSTNEFLLGWIEFDQKAALIFP